MNSANQRTILLESSNVSHSLVTVSPLKPEAMFNDFSVPCALVTVVFQTTIKWLLVRSEMNLTTKELELLQSIYCKKKLNDIAIELNVSYNTLRTHLQNIFKKFRVNSQSELMIKLALFRS